MCKLVRREISFQDVERAAEKDVTVRIALDLYRYGTCTREEALMLAVLQLVEDKEVAHARLIKYIRTHVQPIVMTREYD